MRLVSLDIDPHNRANRIHLGPFVSGLNAVWGARGAGKSTIAKFIRGLLYHRHRDASGYGQDAVDGLVGSLQWADDAGATRVISSADPINDRDYRFSAPYYYGQKESRHTNAANPNATAGDQPWHRIGGEVYDAVFCGRLGETLPERLWQAARELGIHVATGTEQDETYQRLKAEEYRIQQRLHHLRVDDRDRAWWAAERERLATRINELALHPELHGLPIDGVTASSTIGSPLDPIHSAQYREWESQLVQHRAEHSELLTREAELARQMTARQNGDSDAENSSRESYSSLPASQDRDVRSNNAHRDYYGTWAGYAKPPRQVRDYGWIPSETRISNPSETLATDCETVRNRISHLARLIDDLESKLQGRRTVVSNRATSAWESEELRSRLNYADEVLKSWDLYEQTRRRLSEVQTQLQGHGPYHEAARGSFLQCVERYVRELSAGALRRLPTWALEALRRDLGYAAGLSNQGRLESYREVYRDYRADTKRSDYPVPPSQSSERQLVELAMRMAILESAAHRVGRLPLILDDALDGFHGQTLDHVVRVLIEFSRQGQQVLLMTSEPEVAERIRVHHGWVSHLNPGTVETDARAYAPITFRDQSYVTPVRHISRPAAYDEYAPSLAEVNAQLSAASGAYAFDEVPAIPRTVTSPRIYRYNDYPRTDAAPVPVPAPIAQSRRFFLTESSPIEDAPGLRSSLGEQVKRIGIKSVGQWITTDPQWIYDHLGASIASIDTIMARQAEARLMCGVPQLRAFDARVLVGCGLRTPQTLAQMHPGRLLRTVETFLTTPSGQEILRSGTSYELSRITTWIASARRSLHGDSSSDREQRIGQRSQRREGRQGREGREGREGRSLRTRRSSRSSSRDRYDRAERPERRREPRVDISSPVATGLKFYLELDSPIVDAPSIGPSMAEKILPLGIQTVRDLLNANAQAVADHLDDKRYGVDTIIDWQHQATLVCRIPNLRGHDAQMLVACDIRTPEQLLASNASHLYSAVSTFASSKAGQRLLRGASGADLEKVQSWINWSQQNRALRAA